MTLKEMLNKEPEPQHVRLINGAEYIPIGFIEEYLDELDPYWESEYFEFSSVMLPTGVLSMSGSVAIEINFIDTHEGESYKKRTTGSATLTITGEEENKDYVATLQSFCIANAAKRMGRRFGRALNGRLDIGENAPSEKSVELPDENAAQNYISQLKNNQ